MNYYKNNIKHVKGDTYSSALIVEGLGQALDSVYFTCRDSLKNDSTILFEKSLADGGITQVEYDEENDIRKYAVRIDPYDTRNLQAGTYFYDLQITVNTDVFTIMKGSFILEQDASRKGEPTEPEIIIQIKAQLDEINGEVINVTVFDKLDYLSETKGLIKDSLNNLGSEITDDNTFRNYVEKINQIYNDYPKVTGTGTTFTISNTKKAKMNNTLKGNTEQTTYTGKNLLNNNTTSEEKNGITYTTNSDGTVIVNGTATNLSTFHLISNNTLTLSAGTYILSGCPENGSDSTYRLDINDGANIPEAGSQVKDFGTGKTFTLSESLTLTNVRIRIAGGTTINNLVFKPMIRLSSITDNTYEPYVGGTASPNPNYPQNIRVVKGDNTINIIGKNLLDIQYFENGSIDATTGQNTSNNQNGRGNNYISVLPNTTYTLSCNKNVTNIRLSEYKSDKTHIKRDTVNNTNYITITTTANTYYLRWSLNYDNSTIVTQTIIDNLNLQLEKGSTATTYEPHQEQSYVFYLEDLELCKIGDYQDYIYKSNNTWYKYKAIDKVVLDGTEIWQKSSNTSLDRFYLDNASLNMINRSLGYSNYFINSNTAVSDIGKYYTNTNQIVINFSTYDTTTLEQFKTWLSTHNTTVYYILETPTSIEITDLDLIEQLNSLENAISYNDATNIFTEYEEGNTSFIISASALMKGSE